MMNSFKLRQEEEKERETEDEQARYIPRFDSAGCPLWRKSARLEITASPQIRKNVALTGSTGLNLAMTLKSVCSLPN